MPNLRDDLTAAGLRVHPRAGGYLEVWADVRLGNGDIEPAGYFLDFDNVTAGRVRRALDDTWLPVDPLTAAGVAQAIADYETTWRRAAWPHNPEWWPATVAAERDAGAACTHPPDKLYWWVAYDGTLCAGCCVCGAVVAGAIERDEESKGEDRCKTQ